MMDQQFIDKMLDEAKKTIRDDIFKHGINNAVGLIYRHNALREYAEACMLCELTTLTPDQMDELMERKNNAKDAFNEMVKEMAETFVVNAFNYALEHKENT